MNASVSVPSLRSRRGWVYSGVLGATAIVLGAIVILPLLVPAAVYLAFRPSGVLDSIRQEVARSTGNALDREIELALRPAAVALLRAGLACADLPAEARSALGAVHSAEVGLYQTSSIERSEAPGRLLSRVDTVMAKRGWERIVGVVDGQDVVAVFVPQTIPSHRDVSLAVLVHSGSQLVIASVRSNPEAIVDLVLKQSRCSAISRLASSQR